MSEQLGPYAVEQRPQTLFLPNGPTSPQTYSEATARAIDQEARQIVDHMAQRALQLLESHSETLETLAQYLLAHEAIDQSTLALLLEGLQPTKPSPA